MAINLANNNSLANITALPASVSGGAMNLLATQTASSSATLSFTSGIDDTYDKYVFKFINIHPSAEARLTFQANAAGGSGYNETITSTAFQALHWEDDSAAQIGYAGDNDQAQGTAFQIISSVGGIQNDASLSGYLTIYNPSDTTFVKHFMARTIEMYEDAAPGAIELHTAGYFNLTAAIDEIQFKMDSGNIDSGVIKLYGIS